jgi:hypothetical protein
MSGDADSIRRAREIRKEGVEDETAFEEIWPEEEDEWEDEEWGDDEEEWEDEEWEEDEWKVSLTEKVAKILDLLLPRLAGFAIDVMTIALVPTTLMLLTIAFQRTTFGIFETHILLAIAAAVALMIADAKQKLLRRLRLS